jgi:protein-tyrosine phosphatase
MNILFVCTGNTCRSPIAEALLKAHDIESVEVRSAGIYALDGGSMSKNGQLVLENASIPITHTSTSINKQIVDWADLILTMTDSHKQSILQIFPHTKTKVYMYKEFVTPQNVQDVSDPYGGDVRTYENTFQELNALTEELVKRLRGD